MFNIMEINLFCTGIKEVNTLLVLLINTKLHRSEEACFVWMVSELSLWEGEKEQSNDSPKLR